MMASASWIYVILGSYFLFVKWLGPKLMKDRPAFELKGLLIFYNTTQALANLFLGIYVSKGDPKSAHEFYLTNTPPTVHPE